MFRSVHKQLKKDKGKRPERGRQTGTYDYAIRKIRKYGDRGHMAQD